MKSIKITSYVFQAIIIVLIFMVPIASCHQVDYNGQDHYKAKVSKCFLAVFDKDTAYVSLEFLGKNIEGKMKIEYGNGELYNGVLTGFISGDTLVCKYDFQINNFDKWYRNPVALLKTEDKLIMGDGKVMIAWGAGVFDKSVPINYENSRFVFEETNCPID